MSNDPNEIRDDIERTRAELGYDVDALADKVTPSKVMHRQTDKVKGVVNSAKERVFGAAEDAKQAVGDAKDSVSDTVGSMGDAVSDAPHKVAQKAQGNPVAAGLIAFGVGWLVASMIPPTQKEQEATSTLKEKAKPLAGEVADSAKHVAQNLKEPAMDAANSVKDTAAEGVQNVKEEGTSAAENLKDQAKDAKDTVQNES
jgi:ElaB/YqjD/DUF883 family membrane-anchored ribosome-binding protein/gas vesicle protein